MGVQTMACHSLSLHNGLVPSSLTTTIKGTCLRQSWPAGFLVDFPRLAHCIVLQKGRKSLMFRVLYMSLVLVASPFVRINHTNLTNSQIALSGDLKHRALLASFGCLLYHHDHH
jgi:hypothetical protein